MSQAVSNCEVYLYVYITTAQNAYKITNITLKVYLLN